MYITGFIVLRALLFAFRSDVLFVISLHCRLLMSRVSFSLSNINTPAWVLSNFIMWSSPKCLNLPTKAIHISFKTGKDPVELSTEISWMNTHYSLGNWRATLKVLYFSFLKRDFLSIEVKTFMKGTSHFSLTLTIQELSTCVQSPTDTLGRTHDFLSVIMSNEIMTDKKNSCELSNAIRKSE